MVRADRPRPRAVGSRRLPRRAADRRCWCGRSSGRCPTCACARISVDLGRPVPMAGFTHRGRGRAGRPGDRQHARRRSSTRDGNERVTRDRDARRRRRRSPLFERRLDNSGRRTPRLADAEPGEFPIGRVAVTACRGSATPSRCATRRARTTARARRRCGCARCRCCRTRSRRRSSGSARSPTAATPSAATPSPTRCSSSTPTSSSPCTATRSASGSAAGSRRTWQPTGVGLADALLFDDEGPVGRALQTLLLRPAPMT